MADWSKPTLSSTYSNFVSEVNGKFSDLAYGGDPAYATSMTSPPTNSIRWNSASMLWQKYNGSAWADITGTYNVTARDAAKLTTARTLSLTSDVTGSVSFDGSANASITTTLANTAVTAGSYGSASQVATFTTDAKGRLTAAGNVSISVAWSAISSGKPTTLSGYGITDAIVNAGGAPSVQEGLASARPAAGTAGRIWISTDTGSVERDSGSSWEVMTPAYTGDVSKSAKGTALTLATVNSNTGQFGSASAIPVITVNGKGLVTAISTTALGGMAAQASNNVSISGGAISGTAITLKQSTAPSQVAEGEIQWDTDDDLLAVGTATATKTFAPLSPTNPVTATNYTFSTGSTWNGNTISVSYGGTGATSISGVVYGNGTGAMTAATAAQIASAIGTTYVSNATHATSADSASYARGLTRSDSAVDSYNVQSWWDGSRWYLKGYNSTTYHAEVRVGYADAAATASACSGNSVTATTASTANALNTGNSYTVAGMTINGSLNINSAAMYITHYDTDWGYSRHIHSNGGLMGFLNSDGNWAAYSDNSGNFTAAANITAYSDLRLKTDLVKIDKALTKVEQLTGYTFTRKDLGERQTGLIAQDVQKVLPEAVIEREFLSVAYGNMTGLLVEAIKELNAKAERQQAIIESLLARVEALESAK